MDRNTIIGLFLIFAIFVGFSYWNAPSKEEIADREKKQDSIARAQELYRIQDSLNQLEQIKETIAVETSENAVVTNTDSTENFNILKDKYGAFAESSQGENSRIQVETDVMKLDFQSLGGLIYSAELKKYKSHDSLPLVLFRADTAKFGFVFSAANRIINTQDHFFKTYVDGKEFNGQKVTVSGKDSLNISLRLYADNSNTLNPNQYIEYSYTIFGNKYIFDFNIGMKNMETLIDSRNGYIDFNWALNFEKPGKNSR
jgi:YidC/Oxa1 family membrane protein insertase